MNMLKMGLGAFVAAIAMFVTGFLFFATPLLSLATNSVTPEVAQAVQASLAENLGPAGTGTYFIPQATTQEGSIAYASGPIATVHFNAKGYPVVDANVFIWGFVHMFVVCFLLGWALMGIDRRVPDYVSRSKTVIMFSVASSAFMHLGNPIWYHHDWVYAIYLFVADAISFAIAGMILARWFLPVDAVMPAEVKA